MGTQTSLEVISFDDLKQKIIVLINHREIFEDLINVTKCRSLCRKGH